MLPSNLDSLTPVQRLVVEQAFVLAKELESAADSAPDGPPESVGAPAA